jgi:hypothetical protein
MRAFSLWMRRATQAASTAWHGETQLTENNEKARVFRNGAGGDPAADIAKPVIRLVSKKMTLHARQLYPLGVFYRRSLIATSEQS